MKKKKVETANEVGLLQAICESAEDDTPRLVYADWLDENDQPERAEFLRVQCQLATTGRYDPEWPHLHWRQRQLLTVTHKKTWGELPVKPVKQKEFHRGFVDDLTLHAALFLEGAVQLFARIPLTMVRPLRIGPVWADLLASPHVLRLRGLDLHNSALSPARCKALAASERLANLHELNLGANGRMGLAGVNAILGSRQLGSLRRLDLNNNHFGDDALAAFIGNDNFPQLRHLDLSNNGIGPEGVNHLAGAGWLSRLERLDLSGNPLGDEGVRHLAESGILAGHRSLRLARVGLGVEGVRSLVSCPHLSELTELHLEGVQNGDFLKEVAQASTLAKLRVLELGRGTGVGEAGVDALVRSPLAARLLVLDLANYLPPAAFKTLFTAQSLSGLTWLDVSGTEEEGETRIDLAGLLHAATHLSNLHYLAAKGNFLRDPDMAVLADCAHLGGLAELSLRYGTVTAAGVEAMIASPHFNRLCRLKLPFSVPHLDDPIRTRLTARFGADVYSYY
jgi:uncharacterized protein (TIGR02996 family)